MEIKNTGIIPVEVPQTEEKESNQYVEQLRELAPTFVSPPHALIRARERTPKQAPLIIYSSLYFLCVPLAFSTGYFASFLAIFLSSASFISMPKSWLMSSTQ